MHIVFLHGFMGAPREFLWLAASMPCPTEIISLPGHGCSDAKVTIDNVNEWLEEQLIGLKIKECILYGYSLGGRIALNYVLGQERKKIKVEGLILEGAGIGLKDQVAAKERIKNDHAWAENFRRDSMENVLERWYNQPIFADLSAEDRKLMISQKKNLNGARLADCLEDLSIGRMPYYAPELKNLELPLLYMYGSRDEKFHQIASQIESYGNSNITVAEIPDAGHNCHFANIRAVINQTKSFLDSLDTTTTAK